MNTVIEHYVQKEVRAMKRLILFIVIVVSASIFMNPLPTVQASGVCKQTGILPGTTTFVALVSDTILFVPRFVFTSLNGPGHGYPSQRDRHHFSHDAYRYDKGYDKKKQKRKKGRGG